MDLVPSSEFIPLCPHAVISLSLFCCTRNSAILHDNLILNNVRLIARNESCVSTRSVHTLQTSGQKRRKSPAIGKWEEPQEMACTHRTNFPPTFDSSQWGGGIWGSKPRWNRSPLSPPHITPKTGLNQPYHMIKLYTHRHTQTQVHTLIFLKSLLEFGYSALPGQQPSQLTSYS